MDFQDFGVVAYPFSKNWYRVWCIFDWLVNTKSFYAGLNWPHFVSVIL